MKGYLILENGSIFEGTVQSGNENIIGLVSLQEDGSVLIENHKSSTKGLAFNKNGFKVDADATVLSDLNLSTIKKTLNSTSGIYGKIVTDEMPVEYHLYDVKTYIPCGVM